MAYNIKEVRMQKGMTQEELSIKANVSRAIVSKLENEDNIVTSTETLKKIANALDVRVSDIFLD